MPSYHFKFPSRRTTGLFAVLVGITVAHTLALAHGHDFASAISLRLYYLPILYAALAEGLVSGAAVGVLAAFLHVALMFGVAHGGGAAQHGTAGTLLVEHLVETPFLILLGAGAGALRDHQEKERARREEVTELFGKYVSPDLAEALLSRRLDVEGEERIATVLFCDLCGFSEMAERLSPRQLLAVLNTWFGEVVEVVLTHGGFIDKFIGDAVMVVHGVPNAQQGGPLQAIQTALAVLERARTISDRLPVAGLKLRVGIGIHTGPLVAGNVGAARRVEYTVVGDTVNLASRLEGLTRHYDLPLLISEDTVQALGENALSLREIDRVRVKGRQQPCRIYEVLQAYPDAVAALRQQTAAVYHQGLAALQDGRFDSAEAALTLVLEQDPGDAVAELHLSRAREAKANPTAFWEGVRDFATK